MKKLVVLIIVALLAANIWMMYRNSSSKSCNSKTADVTVIDSLENVISKKDTQIEELTERADSLENVLDIIRKRLNL